MTEKHEKINGVIVFHKKTKSGMAVFYPKHDVTIKKDEKIILHTLPSKQSFTKDHEKCPITSYTICEAVVSTEDVVRDNLNYVTTHKPLSKTDQKIFTETATTLAELDALPLEQEDHDKLAQKIMDNFSKIITIRLKQKHLEAKWKREKLAREKAMRKYYESRP